MDIKHSELAAINRVLRLKDEAWERITGAYASTNKVQLARLVILRRLPRGITVHLRSAHGPHDNFDVRLFGHIIAYPDHNAYAVAQRMKFTPQDLKALEEAKRIVRKEVDRHVALAGLIEKAPEPDIDQLLLGMGDPGDLPEFLKGLDA
jgi:hypothetical protein